LIIHGLKDIENRRWRTTRRGTIVVHAGMTVDKEGMGESGHLLPPNAYVSGAAIGRIDIVDVVTDSSSRWAEPGFYHWVLAAPRRFVEPVPCQGELGLWRWKGPLPPIQSVGALPLERAHFDDVLDAAVGSFAEHRMEVLAARYGFPASFSPAQAVAFMESAGLVECEDYEPLRRWAAELARSETRH
jgi:hypothetical protein